MTQPDQPYLFKPEEQPKTPGAPYMPALSLPRRLSYAFVAVLAGVGATFGNALVSVNISNIAGNLDVYVVQASILPAVYVAMNATANLTLIKARAQFGIPQVTH